MLHISKLFQAVQPIGSEFSITWVAKNGEKLYCRRATCTSFHSEGDTMNILCLDSKLVRKVNRYSVIEFNGEEVII